MLWIVGVALWVVAGAISYVMARHYVRKYSSIWTRGDRCRGLLITMAGPAAVLGVLLAMMLDKIDGDHGEAKW